MEVSHCSGVCHNNHGLSSQSLATGVLSVPGRNQELHRSGSQVFVSSNPGPGGDGDGGGDGGGFSRNEKPASLLGAPVD